MAVIIIFSDFGTPQNKVTVCTVSTSICHEVMGPDAMILVFWILTFNKSSARFFCHFADKETKARRFRRIIFWQTGTIAYIDLGCEIKADIPDFWREVSCLPSLFPFQNPPTTLASLALWLASNITMSPASGLLIHCSLLLSVVGWMATPLKICPHPNSQNLWLWPYLEKGSWPIYLT